MTAIIIPRPLRIEQIEAACRFHSRRLAFTQGDTLLKKLKRTFPEWDEPSSRLKCVAINAFYATQVRAVRKMAAHVSLTMQEDLKPRARVKRISELQFDSGPRRFVSFASKLCHIFLDERAYPIYDSLARSVLKWHLGPMYVTDETNLYDAFCRNIDRLSEAPPVKSSYIDVDRYLWIRGQFENWKKSKPVNPELVGVFTNPTREDKADLKQILNAG